MRCEEEVLDNYYSGQISKFVRGMSSVSKLVLSGYDIFGYLNSADHGVPPVFHNLTYLQTSFWGSFSCWKDLLQSFPNLEHLVVDMNMINDIPEEQMNWSQATAPDSVPSFVLSKLKTTTICNFNGDGFKLVEYILRNSIILEELRCIRSSMVEKLRDDRLVKEHKFCKALFNLPRNSSTSKVVFEGEFFASSDDFNKGEILGGFVYEPNL